MFKKKSLLLTMALGLLVSSFGAGSPALAAGSRTFPETGKTVAGRFLEYWDGHGGLAQQGYPISEEMDEMSDTDGKTYTVQYFERSVFELHPENAAPYDVLLSLLGVTFYADKYDSNAPGQKVSTTNAREFTQTGKTIGGKFRTYWEKNGGLAQQGYPISEEFNEKNDTDGKTYKVQYFERAVFEYHPENAGKPSEVLLSLLGKFQHDFRSGGGGTKAPPDNSGARLAVKGWTHVVVFTNNVALFYSNQTHEVATARVNADGTLTTLRTTAQLVEFSTVTQIVPGPNDTVFFYNRADGACSLADVTDDGNVTTRVVYRPFSPIWDIISLDPATHKMVFYSYNDFGTTGVANLNLNNNEVETLKAYNNADHPDSPYWDIIMPIGNAFWINYSRDRSQLYTYNYKADGTEDSAKGAEITQSWSNIAAHPVLNVSYLYFYDKTKGKSMIAVVDDTGTLNPGREYYGLSSEWTHLVAAPNGVFLLYSSETGNIATDQIDTDGSIKALQRYSPAK